MKKLLLSLCLCYSAAGNAQVNLSEKATLVTKTNDTIDGTVQWESERELSELVLFRTADGKEQKFNPGSLKSLQLLNDSLLFEPVTVTKIHNSSKVTITRLAKVICKGYMSLYKMELPNELIAKDGYAYVFVARKNAKDDLLMHAENRSAPGYDKYKGVLRYLTNDSKISGETIAQTAYNENSIATVISKYNEMKGLPGTLWYNTRNKTFFSHQVRIGGIYMPKFNLGNGLTPTGGVGWSAGYAVDIMNPATSKRFYTSLELDYFTVKFPEKTVTNNFNGQTEKAKVSINGVFFHALAVYKLTQKRVTPLILGGIALEYSNIARFFPHIALGLGVKAEKFMTCARYERPVGVGETGWPATGMINFKIGYAFLESKNNNK